ncbi:GIY-YIG nuclease family protein [Sphingomonas soli]|uniref:GIY-YIG nuclease family protein n=1 Tax=Sphingomonas soli TaxID=266127 RepID=UPI0008350579|nr:GIY-YIG nuclease family protein [Sphingomonas soli]
MRDQIVAEIKRIAAATGKAPGRTLFERETGIRTSQWLGIYWARWGDAVREAGLTANDLQGRTDNDFILEQIAHAARHFERAPTYAELRLYARTNEGFPAHSTIFNRFPAKDDMVVALREWIGDKPEFADVAALLPEPKPDRAAPRPTPKGADGHVYLLKSGDHFKIGRSDELEQRVKEIRVALPEAAALVHTIRTDDPPGIEAYWHRRFADKRANGEWWHPCRSVFPLTSC